MDVKSQTLITSTLFGDRDLVKISMERIKFHVEVAKKRGQKVMGAFSGGKDSIVIKELARMAGVEISWFYNQVGIDPPELVDFIKEHHVDVSRVLPPKPFFARMMEKGFPPMRNRRWCCEHLKEYHGDGVVITGVRWEESRARQKRKVFEPCHKKKDRFFLNPIVDWTTVDVWDFIYDNDLPYCSLYDEGMKRIGCIMCPVGSAKNRRAESIRWPKMANAWRCALGRLIKKRQEQDKEPFRGGSTGEEALEWYLGADLKSSNHPDQQCFKFDD